MKRSAVIAVVMSMVAAAARADHFHLFPALDMSQVSDDNVYDSAISPISDRIRRATPSLAMRFDSPRWSMDASAGVVAERYATHTNLDDNRAREHADVRVQYQHSSRLTVLVDASYIATNSLAELNTDTGLAATRLRARRIGVNPALRFRASPTVTFTASSSTGTTEIVDGSGIRSQSFSGAVERRSSARDVLGLEYVRSHIAFTGGIAQLVNTQSVLATWTRSMRAHNGFALRIGPRFNEGAPSLDLTSSFTHSWKRASIAISILRNQATVVGHTGMVDSKSAQAKLAIEPARRLTAYLAPTIFRTTQGSLRGTVYRVSGGMRYDIAAFMTADVAYLHDAQHGAIDPAYARAFFSHSMLTFGLTTHLPDDRNRGDR